MYFNWIEVVPWAEGVEAVQRVLKGQQFSGLLKLQGSFFYESQRLVEQLTEERPLLVLPTAEERDIATLASDAQDDFWFLHGVSL